jgi:hypothetical protein
MAGPSCRLSRGEYLMHLNTPQGGKALPFVLANAKPYALEQYEDDALGYYDPVTQTWRTIRNKTANLYTIEISV